VDKKTKESLEEEL